jgi:hypothetical protein
MPVGRGRNRLSRLDRAPAAWQRGENRGRQECLRAPISTKNCGNYETPATTQSTLLKARDQKWKIDFRFEPKGALFIVSLNGQDKKVRYRFEVTDGDGIFAKIGGGFSMKDDQLDEHITNAIEKELAKEFG